MIKLKGKLVKAFIINICAYYWIKNGRTDVVDLKAVVDNNIKEIHKIIESFVEDALDRCKVKIFELFDNELKKIKDGKQQNDRARSN